MASSTTASVNCAVPKIFISPSFEGHWKFPGGWGPKCQTFVQESLKVNWNFETGGKGGGVLPKNLPEGCRYMYFLEH